MESIRNFCIIAHVDHGKSTLADRMLEITKTVDSRKMKEQMLDRMDLERERGITIKLTPVTMHYAGHMLNLIDTPGHVDFSYEVSRSLAAVEGALLLVDATQGIQAQTLANLYLALEQNLTIIPVINKIDLPAADVDRTRVEIVKLLGCQPDDILLTSAKTGQGITEVLQRVIDRVPPPQGQPTADLRALIFDSNYDEYRGVVAYLRIVDGSLHKGQKIKLMVAKAHTDSLDIGTFSPDYQSTPDLQTGQIGYVVTGFKEVSECRVGDTVTLEKNVDTVPLRGYQEVKPMVFAGVFPKEGNNFEELRQAIAKLKLNDAALAYEPEQSHALGYGFRCGFLGLLHLEIFQERLRREYGLDLIVTVPSVGYQVYTKNNAEPTIVRSPQKLQDPTYIDRIEEPWVSLDVMAPQTYIGSIMQLVQDKRGVYKNTEYIENDRVILHYDIPMYSVLTDFYDKIKSVSSGYASVSYEFKNYQPADVVKMDILVAEEPIEALSVIVYRDDAFHQGKAIVELLKDTLPKQMFAIKLQAAIGGKIIAAERISAMRKDVTAKLYGGDVSRKRKLLEKQKKGKKKMMLAGKGSVEIPSDTFVKLLKR